MQARSAGNIKGIDVSHHQGTIDWPKAAADAVKFAFIKATEGVAYIDPQFRRNAGGAVAVGVKVGFYHYARPEKNTAIAEAEAFVEAVKGLPVHMPYVLDVEGEAHTLGSVKLTAWVDAWLKAVKTKTNRPVMIYTGASFAKTYLSGILSKYPIWIAHYGTNDPMDNPTWDRWAVFQYASNGKVAGISTGNVDMDVMEADFFEEMTGSQKAPKPAAGKTGFPDVPAGHWAENAILAAKKAGIMAGHTDGTFGFGKPVTREELAAVVAKLIGGKP